MTPQIDTALVRRLVAEQFPHWAQLEIRPVVVGGHDNRTFHLGDELSVRLPSAEAYAPQAEKEGRWLPGLAPHLPLPIPAPVALGRPSVAFPFPWSVNRWLPGDTLAAAGVQDKQELARDLAAFLRALWQIDAADGPPAGPHNFERGKGSPPMYWDDYAQPNLPLLGPQAQAAEALWQLARQSEWTALPVWVHGDIAAGNLLVQGGRLSAVIDFGCCAVGDPACDLVMAWTYFSGDSRRVFRESCGLDEQTWQRAAGWAVWKALIVLTDPRQEAWARRTVNELLADKLLLGRTE